MYVGGVAARHGRDSVAPRLLAGYPAVPIVVVKAQGIGGRGGRVAWRCGGVARCGDDHRSGGAARQDALECGGLAAVDGEAVLALDRDDARGESARVHRRLPFGGVETALAAGAAAVHLGSREGEVERVGREAAPDGGAGGA